MSDAIKLPKHWNCHKHDRMYHTTHNSVLPRLSFDLQLLKLTSTMRFEWSAWAFVRSFDVQASGMFEPPCFTRLA
jgi:hypothetical protein